MEYVNCLARKYSFAVALAIIKSKPIEMSITDYIAQLQNQFRNSSGGQYMDIDSVSIDSSDFDNNDYIEDTSAMQPPRHTELVQNQDLTDTTNDDKTCHLDTNERHFKPVSPQLSHTERSHSLLESYDRKLLGLDSTQVTSCEFTSNKKNLNDSINMPTVAEQIEQSQELLGLGDDDIFCETQDIVNLPFCVTTEQDAEKEIEVVGKELENVTTSSQRNFDLHADIVDLGTTTEAESQSILVNLQNSHGVFAHDIDNCGIRQSEQVVQDITFNHGTHTKGQEHVNYILHKIYNGDDDSDIAQMTNIEFHDEYETNMEIELIPDTKINGSKQCEVTTFMDTKTNLMKTCVNTQTSNTETQNIKQNFNLYTDDNINNWDADNIISNVEPYSHIEETLVYAKGTQNIESELKNDVNAHLGKLSQTNFIYTYNNIEKCLNSKHDVQIETDMANTVTQTIHIQNETLTKLLSQVEIGIDKEICTDSVEGSETNVKNYHRSVPFKVVMELNKVKQTLAAINGENKMKQVSGYNSDSPMNFTQYLTPGPWDPAVNQSANYLLAHLSSCSEYCLRQPVTSDIADSLSQLVDLLYERDIVLQFLNEMLPCIDHILDGIFSGKGCGKDELLHKEKNISRLSLLTQSNEMTHYAIDKILPVMESFYTKLGAQALCDAESNDDIENICCAFHTLDVLLERYMTNQRHKARVRDIIEDEPGQELHCSISDIWRKRWDPKFEQASVKPGSRRERSDVVGQCSKLLNKYIVSCMNRYSLISYAALECYNTLHT